MLVQLQGLRARAAQFWLGMDNAANNDLSWGGANFTHPPSLNVDRFGVALANAVQAYPTETTTQNYTPRSRGPSERRRANLLVRHRSRRRVEQSSSTGGACQWAYAASLRQEKGLLPVQSHIKWAASSNLRRWRIARHFGGSADLCSRSCHDMRSPRMLHHVAQHLPCPHLPCLGVPHFALSSEFGHTPAHTPMSAQIRSKPVNQINHIGPNMAGHNPNVARLGSNLANFGQSWSNVGRSWSNSGCRPKNAPACSFRVLVEHGSFAWGFRG